MNNYGGSVDQLINEYDGFYRKAAELNLGMKEFTKAVPVEHLDKISEYVELKKQHDQVSADIKEVENIYPTLQFDATIDHYDKEQMKGSLNFGRGYVTLIGSSLLNSSNVPFVYPRQKLKASIKDIKMITDPVERYVFTVTKIFPSSEDLERYKNC